MNCEKVKELLWAYLENKTTAEETAEIETHLEGCVACAAEGNEKRFGEPS